MSEMDRDRSPEMSAGEPMPRAIAREGDAAIRIEWSDGTATRWTAAALRRRCPCATCREKRRAESSEETQKPAVLPVISAAEARPLRIESMKPVGNYAYQVAFSDGHDSGIFPFASLHGSATS